ncbi:hypothetical protein [Chryseobacterium vrystaatense]|uniref:Lipoprotein n=1 Tax=Chryseobacterium vrystaatense TaxID=307480 RepID=A0ABR4URE8_9FLAO|nr:hypothetical protein [Chryseobacterium vrystaatense]KFF27843.1 hypothetical protein IW16_01060 [Chryseobacterium vrystaatense]
MKKIIISLFITSCLLSCQNKSNELKSKKGNMNMELIKQHMKFQDRIELSENDTDILNLYHLTDTDIEIGGQVLSQGMKNNGYIVPDDETFINKTKEIFEKYPDCSCVDVKKHNDFTTYFVNPTKEKNIIKSEYDYTYDHIFAFPKYKLISTLPLLNDMISLSGNNLNINLDQSTIARNKYLFNNNKGELAWLLFNDKEFLKILLVHFGYDKEEKINEFVLKDLYKEYSEESPNSIEKIGEVFFVKDCDGKLRIRKNLLKYVDKITTKDNNKYLLALSEYIISILYSKDIQSSFTEDEKAEIVAHISNIEIPKMNEYKVENTTVWNAKASSLFYLQSENAMNHPEVLIILKKHNYFGFVFLKNYIESGHLLDEDPTPPQGDD